MNAGLSNLTTLKAWLLGAGMVAGHDYDAQILAIGRGVAAQLEQYCNRKFTRTVDDTWLSSADRTHVLLPRYPVEAISRVELLETIALGWIDQGSVSDVINTWSSESGVVYLPAPLSWLRGAQVRLTYTGGYWFNQAEDDAAAPDEVREQTAVVALEAAAESLVIPFPVEFASLPAVALTLQVPAAGVVITVVPSAVTTAGFTALFGFPIPATGYTLAWTARAATANATPETQPAGAEAVPPDLLLAWQLQCEFVWSVRDKLGLSVGEKPAAPALAQLDLLPDVKAKLRPFLRYAL